MTPFPDTGDGLVERLQSRCQDFANGTPINGGDIEMIEDLCEAFSALEGEVEGLKASRSQPCADGERAARGEAEPSGAERLLRHRTRQLAQCGEAWCSAAERALTLLPGASNSSHPAHSLWLRVELHRAPSVEVVLS